MEKKTVLVVDDEEPIRNLFRIYLTNEGYAVLTAKNGADVIPIAEKQSVDIIVFDITMPKMGGIESMKKVHKKRPDLPYILMSREYNQKSGKELAIENGAVDYISKPLSFDDIINKIKEHLPS